MSFSNKIKHALVDKEMNPSDLARKTGYSPQYMHNLLKGGKRWNEESLSKVCDVLGLEIEIKRKVDIDADRQH